MNSEDSKKPMNPKREELIKLSVQAFEMRESLMINAKTIAEFNFWEAKTINYMLLNHIYKTDGATEFNTFNQWKADNATIKKGSQAFVIWGQPIKAIKKGGEQEQLQNQLPELKEQLAAKYQYWPMCYLFSDKQVLKPAERKTEEPIAGQETAQAEDGQLLDLNYII